MENKLSVTSGESRKPKRRWEKSITSEKGTKTTCVREAENGFIVHISISKDTEDGYKYEDKEYISKENPISNMKDFEEFEQEGKKEKLDLFGGMSNDLF